MSFIVSVASDVTADPSQAAGPSGTSGLAAALSGRTQLDAVRLLEEAGVDFVTLGDSFTAPSAPAGGAAARLDAMGVLSWIAPATSTIGLVPTVTTTHTEPFLVATATATLDYAAQGRGGWQPGVSIPEEEARNVGRRPAGPASEAWREAAEVIDLVRRLWDSWEDDAVIRDEATGRFVDREKLHYVDFEGTDSAGERFTIKGPSIVPRPPQGQLPVVVAVSDAASLATAVAGADVVLLDDGSGMSEDDVRAALDAAGRDTGSVRVLLSVPYAHSDAAEASLVARIRELQSGKGIDGVHLRPADLAGDAAAIASAVVPGLRAAGLLAEPPAAATLRERLGLPVAVNRYAVAG